MATTRLLFCKARFVQAGAADLKLRVHAILLAKRLNRRAPLGELAAGLGFLRRRADEAHPGNLGDRRGGVARRPEDVACSVRDATGAAARARPSQTWVKSVNRLVRE